jgi:hypothetical protein
MAKKSTQLLKLATFAPWPSKAGRRSPIAFDASEYLRARRAGRVAHAGIPSVTWFDHLTFEIPTTLDGHGIDHDRFENAMGSAKPADIDEACLLLLEKLIESRSVAKKESAASRRGLVTPESLIRHLALALMELSYLECRPLPEALVIVLRELLGGTNTDLIREHWSDNRRLRDFAAQILAQMPNIGVRKLAKRLGVSPSTISRWLREEEFHEDIRLWKFMFDGPFRDEVLPRISRAQRRRAR